MNINIQFLEEFKHLDKLCRELYQSGNGVTAYIDDMKQVSVMESQYIDNWNRDLQRLTVYRNLRNRLTHECDTLTTDLCDQSDIAWISAFFDRILQRTDPMALLECHRKTYQQYSHPKHHSQEKHTQTQDHQQYILRSVIPRHTEETPDMQNIQKKSGKQLPAFVFSILIILDVVLFVFALINLLS